MVILTVKKLKKRGIDLKGKTSFVFQNKLYKRISIVGKNNDISLIKDKYKIKGLNLILVEHQIYFSIWRETSSLNDTKEELNDFVNQKLKDLGL